MVIENTAAYANVAEYGGWPVRAAATAKPPGFIRGAAMLGGRTPGPRTQRAPGGKPRMTSNVSRQAPKGMVRATFIELEKPYVADLEEALETFWDSHEEGGLGA